MSIKALEQRVANLEKQLSALLGKPADPPVKDWRRTIGMFANDAFMKEVDEEARKYRERDRQKARAGAKAPRKRAAK